MRQRIDTDKLKELAEKRHKELEEVLARSRYGIMTPNEIRESLGMSAIKNRVDYHFAPRITNCKNCAAPLTKDGYCEYCGTQY